MEEKTVTKINLSTFFLILAIIALIIMGMLIYKTNFDKTREIQKSSILQAQVDRQNETISELQSKITNTSSNTDKYSYSIVKGSYKGKAKDDNEDVNRNYELHLYENGTFSYINYTDTQKGQIGNYTLLDNKIILNYWFNTGNDTSLTATSGSKTLIINMNNSITDSNPDSSISSNLTLEKVDSNESADQANNVNYLINNYSLSNGTNN